MTVTSEDTCGNMQVIGFITTNHPLTGYERQDRDRVREFVDREVIRTAADYRDRAPFPFDRLPGLGEPGIMGGIFPEAYGDAGWNNVAYGLGIAELARGSGSLSTFPHILSGLAMAAIHELGSE